MSHSTPTLCDMKRTEARQLGDIIKDFLKQQDLEDELDEHRASALWPSIVGAGINRYTISRHVSKGVMTVHLSSAPLRNELMITRSSLIARLNEALGREVIKEIVFK